MVFKSNPSSSHSLLTTSSLSNSTVILLNWVTPSRKKLIRSTNVKLNITWPILTLDPVPCCHIVNHWQISNRNWISPRCQKKTWTQQWRRFCKSDSSKKVYKSECFKYYIKTIWKLNVSFSTAFTPQIVSFSGIPCKLDAFVYQECCSLRGNFFSADNLSQSLAQ